MIPLSTIFTSLQQSVAGHKNLYGGYNNPNSTEIITQRAKMTSIDKKRIEIAIKVVFYFLEF